MSYQHGCSFTRVDKIRQHVEAERTRHEAWKRRRVREEPERPEPTPDERLADYLAAKRYGELHNPTTFEQGRERLAIATDERAQHFPPRKERAVETRPRQGGRIVPQTVKEAVRRRALEGESTNALALEFGLSAPQVSQYKHGRPGKWKAA